MYEALLTFLGLRIVRSTPVCLKIVFCALSGSDDVIDADPSVQ